MKFLSVPIALAAWLAVPASAQSNLSIDSDGSGPRAVVERFVALNASEALSGPEGQALLGGELADLRLTSVGSLAPADRVVMLANGHAVARLPASADRNRDHYLYMRRSGDGAWKIEAVRALALPAFFATLRDYLRNAPTRSEEDEEMLANSELTLQTDAELRTWFAANRVALDRLRQLAQAGGAGTDEARQIVSAIHGLGANADTPGLVIIVLGGILDNSVGFLHADDPGAVPAIDPGEYIWIEPVGGGWYLFRTT
jgi:hypothetical protein